MDGAAEGEDGNLPEGAGALEMKTPPKQSLDGAPEKVRVGQPPEVLRLQCVEREEARGEAALYSSQPGGPWTGEQAGRLAREQLPPLFDGRGGNGRDRIAMDGAAAGKDGNLPEGAGALEMKTPPKQSLDGAPERVRVGQPPGGKSYAKTDGSNPVYCRRAMTRFRRISSRLAAS